MSALGLIYDRMIADPSRRELSESRLWRHDGSTLDVEVHLSAQQSSTDWVIVGVVRDITERKQAEQGARHLANYDALTGLPNRSLYYQSLSRNLHEAESSQREVAVLCINLDGFKYINDTYGAAIGDELLRQFSDRLVRCVRTRDSIARLGADEFSLSWLLAEGQHTLSSVSAHLRECLRPAFDLSGNQINISASIGSAVYPTEATGLDALLSLSKAAMYRAKQTGRTHS